MNFDNLLCIGFGMDVVLLLLGRGGVGVWDAERWRISRVKGGVYCTTTRPQGIII